MLYRMHDDGSFSKIEVRGVTDELIRPIDRTEINNYLISTVFLGIDHNYSGIGDPILFETMIFDDASGEIYQERCRTFVDAIKMHKDAEMWLMKKIS